MYCPACAGEFRDDIDRCPDCGPELTRKPMMFRGRPTGPDFDADEPVELFWTADPQFLIDAASLLRSSAIPFTTDGAETLNPALLRTQDDPPEPTMARLLVPGAHHDAAEALLEDAGLDPGASTLGQLLGPDPSDAEPYESPTREFFLTAFAFVDLLRTSLILGVFVWIWLTSR